MPCWFIVESHIVYTHSPDAPQQRYYENNDFYLFFKKITSPQLLYSADTLESSPTIVPFDVSFCFLKQINKQKA